VTCDASTVDVGIQTPEVDCARTQEIPGGTRADIRVDCTDSEITGNQDKRHLVMVPDAITRDALWLHVGSTAGRPTNTTNIGEAAMMSGYRYISLAYTNNVSGTERCRCPHGPRAPEREGLAGYELVYGDDVTDFFDMDPDEAIVRRLLALLDELDERPPNGGWDVYVDDDGEVVWDLVTVSGFSQGGGMVGPIARDHGVDPTMYLSKGAAATFTELIDPASTRSCTAHSECDSGLCYPLGDVQCSEPGDTAFCLNIVPALYTFEGADTDGDGRGNGDETQRATPSERQFAVIHRDEPAFGNSPVVFTAWGMVDVDASTAPYDAQAQLFSTDAPPRGDCSEHQSMDADACQVRDGSGGLVVRDAWLHAMNALL
jgi:hypothetical protein